MEHKTLTNREVLTALLDSKIIQEAIIKEGENTPPKWFNVVYCPFFTTVDLDEPFKRPSVTEDLYIYRIKPETETVRVFNGVELPDCITEPLQYGETYYVAHPTVVVNCTWSGHRYDSAVVASGLAYRSRRDAEIHHKALTKYETIEKEVS